MNSQLLIRAIPPYTEALSRATEQEKVEAIARFSTESRRAEWLTWRSVVREIAGDQVRIEYNPCGAPEGHSENHILYIGVSHCRGRVAVAVSERPCGVDIEWSDRNFERAATKYLSNEERAMERIHPERMCGAVWCAKEAVYKYFSAQGRKYPDFLNDIRVISSELAAGRMYVAAGDEPIVEVHIEWSDEGLIVASTGI
ncbi:MAG: 4'-phosphopantetheinyl transferase superfamily protein [Rikenellaceae bacterium]|nr:4'-phosphopantetheinyl transferase superfamily protein [Rikenellaceae bacterium]